MNRFATNLAHANTNRIIFILVCIILGFGLNILLASTSFLARQEFGDPYFFLKKQVSFAILGILAMIIFSQVSWQMWREIAWPFYFISLFLLVLVFVPGIGHKAGGAWRWIQIAGISLQPSDPARLATIMVLARLFSNRETIQSSNILVALVVVAAPVFLIAVEQDLGTALHLVIAAGIFLTLTRFPFKIHLTLVFMSAPLLYFAIFNVPYRLERLKAFLDPWKFRYEAAYQLVASMRSFLSGGVWGNGLGEGLRRHNLQARHTDFILAIVAEDLGIAGIILLLVLFFGLTIYGFLLMTRVKEDFPRLLGSGILLLFILQATINMCVTMGMIPTTGINLPLFSYGGTSLLTYMIAFGIFLNITREVEP